MARDVALIGGAVYLRASSLEWKVRFPNFGTLIVGFLFLIIEFPLSGKAGLISSTWMEPVPRRSNLSF